MDKHTPGPWKVDEAEDLPIGVIEDNEDGGGICDVNRIGEEAIANAHLIAAAPKLLKAVRLFMEQYDIPGDRDRASRPEIRAAYEALAQVEGRS